MGAVEPFDDWVDRMFASDADGMIAERERLLDDESDPDHPVDEFVRWCSGMNDGKVDERALARFMDEYPGLSQSQFGDELRDFVRGQ